MKTRLGLLVGWLLAALLLLGMDGRLPGFLAGAVPGSLLLLGLGARCASSSPRRATTGRACRSATGWPTTSADR